MLPDTVSRLLGFGAELSLLQELVASLIAAFVIGNLMLGMTGVAGS
jgi:hypothetical protein